MAAQQARCACPKSTPVRPNSGADPHAPGLGTSQQAVTTVARRRSWRVVLCHGSPLSVVAARLAGGHDGRLTRSPDGPTTLYLDGCGTSGERQHRPSPPVTWGRDAGFQPSFPGGYSLLAVCRSALGPSPLLGNPLAWPFRAARAAAWASVVSVLPNRRRELTVGTVHFHHLNTDAHEVTGQAGRRSCRCPPPQPGPSDLGTPNHLPSCS